MAHSAPSSRTPRMLELILAAVVLSAGVALAVVAILALEHPQGRTAQSLAAVTSSSSSSSVAAPSGSTEGGQPAVVVLNDTTNSALAEMADVRLHSGGWTVSRTGTFAGGLLSTAVYYDPQIAAAEQAAQRLKAQFPAFKRVLPRFAGLPAGPVIVVLASDYS